MLCIQGELASFVKSIAYAFSLPSPISFKTAKKTVYNFFSALTTLTIRRPTMAEREPLGWAPAYADGICPWAVQVEE